MGRLLSSVGAALGLTPSEHVNLKPGYSSEPKLQDDVTKEDCATCKFVGTTSLTACGVYCITVSWKNPKQFSGAKLRNLRIAGVTMGTGFLALAASRYFNLGPFAHLKPRPNKENT